MGYLKRQEKMGHVPLDSYWVKRDVSHFSCPIFLQTAGGGYIFSYLVREGIHIGKVFFIPQFFYEEDLDILAVDILPFEIKDMDFYGRVFKFAAWPCHGRPEPDIHDPLVVLPFISNLEDRK